MDDLRVEQKILACIGFGIDHFHGVCHCHFLEAVAALTQSGDYLGTFSLLPQMAEVQRYREAAEHVFAAMPDHVSIVTSSILSAIGGQYGDYHVTPRTAGSELWINPLMGLYWCFRLEGVARRNLYLDAMKQTQTYIAVDDVIEMFQAACEEKRPYREIPL